MRKTKVGSIIRPAGVGVARWLKGENEVAATMARRLAASECPWVKQETDALTVSAEGIMPVPVRLRVACAPIVRRELAREAPAEAKTAAEVIATCEWTREAPPTPNETEACHEAR